MPTAPSTHPQPLIAREGWPWLALPLAAADSVAATPTVLADP